MKSSLNDFVRSEYLRRYCDADGERSAPVNWHKFTNTLLKLRNGADADAIRAAVSALEVEITSAPDYSDESLESWLHQQYLERGFRKSGEFKGWSTVCKILVNQKPAQKSKVITALEKLRKPGSKYSLEDPYKVTSARVAQRSREEMENLKESRQQREARDLQEIQKGQNLSASQSVPSDSSQSKSGAQFQFTPAVGTSVSFGAPAKNETQARPSGSFGFKFDLNGTGLEEELHNHRRELETASPAAISKSRDTAGPSSDFEKPAYVPPLKRSRKLNVPAESNPPVSGTNQAASDLVLEMKKTSISGFEKPAYVPPLLKGKLNGLAKSHWSTQPASAAEQGQAGLVREMKKASITNNVNRAADNSSETKSSSGYSDGKTPEDESSQDDDSSEDDHDESGSSSRPSGSEAEDKFLDYLLTQGPAAQATTNSHPTDIEHAPTIPWDIVEKNTKLLPQYGLIGSYSDSGDRVYHNTNVPFATFVCGVQGSGKSHTTSCLLENALIPSTSPRIGRLEKPLSAMVFAYDEFNGDGSGFNISEAASLASSNPKLSPFLKAKKVTVLVSPSNPVIKRIYSKLPNVTVVPFKIHPRNLNVKTMLTLMSVDESNTVPLYLAQLTKILRDINVEYNGYFNYPEFKRRLRGCDFNPAQENMLQMRLDLLESFLDLKGNAPQPTFEPGEITIMDMSCPFVDENTACILFKLGLDRYLESKVAGKMVVLDEAHKYMLNVPGAKVLNKELIKLIRLQRHKGVRTIIATQEPTLLTDLIALCDVAVIHRFSSPEWFSALKKHIPMSNQDHNVLLEDIESLHPGTALVYSPKSILGLNEKNELIKGTGKFVKIKVRNRITSDGGRSVLAV